MFFESMAIAFQSLWANKLRLVLTMIGIVIGVATVIVLVSLGMAMKMQSEKFFSGFGLNTLQVYGNTPGVRSKLSVRDAKAIALSVPGVKRVIPEPVYTVNIAYQNIELAKMVTGTLPEYLEVHNLNLKYGRFIADTDLSHRNKVVVLGTEPAKILFNNSNPVGQAVRINNIYFRVVGVCSAPMEGLSNLDEIIIIPFSTAQEYFAPPNEETLSSILIEIKNTEDLHNIEKAVTELLKSNHGIRSGQKEDFMIQNSAAMIKQTEAELRSSSIFLYIIATLSLFVGGIGIMNIMLISVTQHTREIGIRKALGATYWHILMQFLIEALVVSLAGSIIGIVGGCGATFLAEMLFNFPYLISLKAIAGSAGSGVFVGLVFGIWPAHRAALLDPVEALRYEA